MWFHSVLANAGYCSTKKPKLYKYIGKGNTVIFFYRFKSYSFYSFIWLFDLFFRNNLKVMPFNLYEYLTPLALATLFLSSSVRTNGILKTQTGLNTSLRPLISGFKKKI